VIQLKKNVAIIDLGSNSVRTMIIKIFHNGSYVMVDQFRFMVRLSQGMGDDHILQLEPMKQTIKAIRTFRWLLERFNVQKDDIHCVATAAVRRAKNQSYFLKLLKQQTGLDFDAITGMEEAYYTYLGVVNTIDIRDFIMIDIGGASTEIALVRDRKLKETAGFDFGAVTLSETFLGTDHISSKNIEKTRSMIINAFHQYPWINEGQNMPLVGVGGSIRTIAKINKNLVDFPFERMHNYRLNKEEINSIYQEILSVDLKKRKQINGIGKTRADIIAGGTFPVQCLLEYLQINQLIVSGNGLREGLFYYYYAHEFGIKDYMVEDVLVHSIENLLKLYDMNISHCYHVRYLVLQLFDFTHSLHQWGEWERKILSVASMLHDIGTYVDYYNHQQHGFYLIMNSRINGLTNKELLYCAFLVGMHRVYSLKENWKKYKSLLDRIDYKKIKKMSLLLRIAEHLDRSEYGKVRAMESELDDKAVHINIFSNSNLELEISSSLIFREEFQKLMKRNLIISQKYRIPTDIN